MSTEKGSTELAATDDARQQIEGLVQRFARSLHVYTRPDYKETQNTPPPTRRCTSARSSPPTRRSMRWCTSCMD